MQLNLTNAEAKGRVLGAARTMVGLDQASLAVLAGVSAGTISNVERGRDVKLETFRAIRKALSKQGVTIVYNRNNGHASVIISFSAGDDDDE